jgi:hypothetical protein
MGLQSEWRYTRGNFGSYVAVMSVGYRFPNQWFSNGLGLRARSFRTYGKVLAKCWVYITVDDPYTSLLHVDGLKEGQLSIPMNVPRTPSGERS